jgi:hypothetical protein
VVRSAGSKRRGRDDRRRKWVRQLGGALGVTDRRSVIAAPWIEHNYYRHVTQSTARNPERGAPDRRNQVPGLSPCTVCSNAVAESGRTPTSRISLYERLYGPEHGGQRVTCHELRYLGRNPMHGRWPRMWNRYAREDSACNRGEERLPFDSFPLSPATCSRTPKREPSARASDRFWRATTAPRRRSGPQDTSLEPAGTGPWRASISR